MFFGLTFEKLLVIGAIAAMLLGPERLPRYAEALARFTKRARGYLDGAKTRVQEEMGDDFEDVDWRKLDPRQYDPRRIIREALLDDAPLVPPAATTTSVTPEIAAGASAGTPATPATAFTPDGVVPFDSEAT